MSAPRLAFLYPRFFRQFLSTESAAATRPAKYATGHRRAFRTSTVKCYPPQQERYGTANEPSSSSESEKKDGQPKREHRKAEIVNEDEEPRRRDFFTVTEDTGKTVPSAEERTKLDAGEAHPEEPVPTTALQLTQRPLERVLHMEPPSSNRRGDDRHPHMQAPPYVHHFDTYTLVDDLKKSGFDQQQSITVMKAVRGLLSTNMQMAREALVSKSDVENESYLFKAACSELRTEVQNGRKAAADKMRSERAHLQHEVDILSQKVSQETLTLKDELKGMFDDRKMAVRSEQRKMENMTQELNYKIQTQLTGESKGDVEGLRWFLTRRAAFFIGGFARGYTSSSAIEQTANRCLVLVLGSIRYSIHMTHLQQQERQRLREADEVRHMQHTTPSRSISTQTGESTDTVLSSMGSETGQSYVSLG